jgi:uncharacterized protein YdaL
MEWLIGISSLWLVGRKINDSYVYTQQKKKDSLSKPTYRSHLDQWDRFDFADDIGYNYMDEHYDKKRLDEMGIAIGDIDTYRGLQYTEEDDENCNTNATQGIRITTPAIYDYA